MELEQLRQLTAISEAGTLSAAAARLHISQPALSRSMQRLEAELGQPLFDRTKNRMHLNEAGELAVERAREVLRAADGMVTAVREYGRRQRTLRIGSCTPAPTWMLVPLLMEGFPDTIVSPELMAVDAIETALRNGGIDIAVLPYEFGDAGFESVSLMMERLLVNVPADHPLAGRGEISLDELDGERFLSYAGIGLWREVHRRHLPHSIIDEQDDYLALMQLAATTSANTFVTDASSAYRAAAFHQTGDDRHVRLALTDADTSMTFYLVARAEPGSLSSEVFDWVSRRLAMGRSTGK